MTETRVPPTGPTDAKIAIVGEAPGKTEVDMGEPFVGRAGKLLNRFLRMSGIPRSECYLTNVSKVKPKYNNFKRRFYDNGQPTEELLGYRKDLRRELADISPNVIVTVGNEPTKALTGHGSITNIRGSILGTDLGKVIPTIHPSAVLRFWDYFPYVLFDFNRVKEEAETPEITIPDYELITNPSISDVEEAFMDLFTQDVVAFDIEVKKTERHPDMISFCGDPSWSICIPFVKIINGGTVTSKNYWTQYEEERVWKLIADLLADPSVGMVAHNANFDVAYMERWGCPTNNLYMDTMNAFHSVYPELKKGLGYVQSICTKIPYHKSLMAEDRQKYNALDSLSARRAVDTLEQELKDFGTYNFYTGFIKKAVKYYRKPSNRGIKVDLERRKELETEYEQKEQEIQAKIDEACPWQIDTSNKDIKLNPRSPKQLKEYFYNKRDYYTYKKNGKPTTNEDALKRLSRKYPDDPIPDLVLKARSVRKTLGTYVRVPIDPDGRMRCSYLVSGTVTGRLSSRKSINKTGTNLQNIQHGDVREMFIPSHDDWLLTEADLSGADARVVAYESEDPGLILLFESGADYHSTNTFMIFDEVEVPNPEHIEKYDVPQDLRKKSKSISHGANYGRSYKSIALELGIGETEAKERLNKYHNTYPGIEQWHRRIQRQLRETATLETPLGRKRQFFGSLRRGRRGLSNHVLNQAYSYVPQSVVGDIIHKGFIRLHERLKAERRKRDFPAYIILNVHDSLVVEHHKDVLGEVRQMMREAMEIPFTCRGRKVLIPVDFETGNNWREL